MKNSPLSPCLLIAIIAVLILMCRESGRSEYTTNNNLIKPKSSRVFRPNRKSYYCSKCRM